MDLSITVMYEQPAMRALRDMFDQVASAYDGIRFVPANAHLASETRDGLCSLGMIVLPDNLLNGDVETLLRERGMRPATYEEALAYARAWFPIIAASDASPRPCLKFVATGSVAMVPVDEGDSGVAMNIAHGRIAPDDGARVRHLPFFECYAARSHLNLLFDIGFLDKDTVVLGAYT